MAWHGMVVMMVVVVVVLVTGGAHYEDSVDCTVHTSVQTAVPSALPSLPTALPCLHEAASPPLPACLAACFVIFRIEPQPDVL